VQDIVINDKSMHVVYKDASGGLKQVKGDNAIIAMGGIQKTDTCMYQNLGRTDLTLQECGFHSLVSADTVIGGSMTRFPEDRPTVIVGSSHSTWSLLADFKGKSNANVTVIERGPPKHFFYSEAEATAAGVKFDRQADVCPITGRVHRFRGVRWAGRDLSLRSDKEPWLNVVREVRDRDALCDTISQALVICASGYQVRLPRIFVNGIEATVERPVNTPKGNLVTKDGVMENVFVYGLGAGLHLGSWIGGELSSWGDPTMSQADGVWLYQFDVGGIIYDQLLHGVGKTLRRDGWLAIYNKKAKRLDEIDAPMHHFGGYEMFTWQQWEQQVALLAEQFPPAEPGSSLLEVGVGAGAFASVISSLRPALSLTGVDAAASAVKVAGKRLKGNFFVAGAEDLPAMFGANSFDFVVSFGLTTYLESMEVAEQLLRDMLRVSRKFAYVGEVSDLARKDVADALRAKSHVNSTSQQQHMSSTTPSHLYVPKEMFHRVAEEVGARLVIKDHDALGLTYATAAYRFSAYFFLP